ncbi:MAG: thioredoxin [Brevinemataceae bacterium]
MADNVMLVNDQTFQKEVLESDIPVLVDFFAEWCAPCRMIAPFISQTADEYSGKVKVVKCNIDEAPHSASGHGVTSIPTLVMFKGGEAVSTKVGALPLAQIKSFVESEL